VVLLFSPSFLWAQDTERTPPRVQMDRETMHLPVVEGTDVRFARLSRSQGLSQQRVTRIVQDDRGFLWFATQYGLNRYDGYRFRVFKHDPADSRSLGGVYIFSLFKDRKGQLWIGCDYSLDRYDPVTETFVHYRLDPLLKTDLNGPVKHISQDSDGLLWLATANGIYRLDEDTGRTERFRHDPSNPFSLSSDDVKFSGQDRAGNFWIAGGEGLDQFDRARGRTVLHVPLRESRDLSFYEDRRGVFWVLYASGNGLATLDRRTQRLTRVSFALRELPGSPLTGVSSMLEDGEGTLWLGTFSDGLLRYDPHEKRFTRFRNEPSNGESLSENRITTLFEDREGNIWTGFGATEPAFFATRPLPFTKLPFDARNPQNLGEALVNVLYEDRKGILWMGTTGALNRLDRTTGGLTHLDVPGNGVASDVLSLIEDRSGTMWIGTSGQGLYRRDAMTGKLTAFRHSDTDPTSLSDDSVIRLFNDHAGNLWVGTLAGLNRYDPASQSFRVYRHRSNGAATPYEAIAEDASGMLWLGTYGSSVLRFDPSSGRFTPVRDSRAPDRLLSDDRVNTLVVDHSGILWAGTQNGLDRIDPATGAISHYSERDGLASNAVSCIVEDDAGDLWMGTSAGLSRLDAARSSFRNYSQADGLPGPDLTGWSACFRGAAGEMFVGGFAGAAVFKPSHVAEDGFAPPVALTEFRLFGSPVALRKGSPLSRTIDYTKELTLSHAENSFSLEFTALSFRSPLTNRYRYELEGVDERWREVGSDRRFASYTTLPPGKYTFRVQGATSRGLWGEPGVSVIIHVTPPWWGTWWFRTLIAVVIVLAVLGSYWWRVRQITRGFNIRIEERVSERTRIARELHDSLLQGFQGLMFRLQAARDLLPLRANDAAAALEIAMERGDRVIEEGRATVQNLRSSASSSSDLPDTLTALVEELTSEAGERSVSYRVLVEGKPRPVSPLIRDDVYRIAREALRNATQHARARHIEAELHYGELSLSLRIRDDGVGIDSRVLDVGQRPGHWGLQGMRERAESIGGRLDVWSEQGAGTETELSLPASVAYGAHARSGRGMWLRSRIGRTA